MVLITWIKIGYCWHSPKKLFVGEMSAFPLGLIIISAWGSAKKYNQYTVYSRLLFQTIFYNFNLCYLDGVSHPICHSPGITAAPVFLYTMLQSGSSLFISNIKAAVFPFHMFVGQWLMQYIKVAHLNEWKCWRSRAVECCEKLQSFSFRLVHNDLAVPWLRVREKRTLEFSDCFFYSACVWHYFIIRGGAVYLL